MELTLTLKHFLKTFSLIGLTSASIIPDLSRFPSSLAHLTPRDKTPWPYGVIGDSWGSGVAYNNDILYDNNLDYCLRTKESYGPQLEADTSWTGDFSSGLRNAACSGSELRDLAKGDYQMGKVGKPNVVVMTSGGNNIGFGPIINLCIYHANPTHNYGAAYKDDDPNNPTGDCGKALKDASTYITGPMRQDLINTINDILADPSVDDNPDFLLYVTGYARFFGPDYDPWCENEYWNIPSVALSPTPYLSKELRTAFNDRVSDVNSLYKDTIESQFSNKVRYIDTDTGFGGHRFCEPGANHADQLNTDTHFDGVYLWNLNWPWQVANQPAPQGVDPDNISPDEARNLFGDDGGVTAWSEGSGSGNVANVPSNGWRIRPFHPRYTGFTSIKKAILAQLKNDGLPKAQSSGSSPPPSGPPAYAPGTCSFHLEERETCADNSNNLFAKITMYDNDKAVIGQTNGDPLDNPINVADPLNFQSKLPYPLVVVGEHENDYVQFNYNGLQFTSRDTSGKATCSNGGWDPRNGPKCNLQSVKSVAVSADS
ncbi:MAG: hypothetical protein LQ338_002163 [Usnochroma carphineum]|nr:MAG: hypothetical protein LQ338_002163 [Usnochroma carphineum]